MYRFSTCIQIINDQNHAFLYGWCTSLVVTALSLSYTMICTYQSGIELLISVFITLNLYQREPKTPF